MRRRRFLRNPFPRSRQKMTCFYPRGASSPDFSGVYRKRRDIPNGRRSRAPCGARNFAHFVRFPALTSAGSGLFMLGSSSPRCATRGLHTARSRPSQLCTRHPALNPTCFLLLSFTFPTCISTRPASPRPGLANSAQPPALRLIQKFSSRCLLSNTSQSTSQDVLFF